MSIEETLVGTGVEGKNVENKTAKAEIMAEGPTRELVEDFVEALRNGRFNVANHSVVIDTIVKNINAEGNFLLARLGERNEVIIFTTTSKDEILVRTVEINFTEEGKMLVKEVTDVTDKDQEAIEEEKEKIRKAIKANKFSSASSIGNDMSSL